MQVGVDVKSINTNFGGHGFTSFRDIATFNFGQIPFIYPWSSKFFIDWNWLKKFKQVAIYVTCMNTNFGGHGFSTFGDTTTLKNGQISLSDHGL